MARQPAPEARRQTAATAVAGGAYFIILATAVTLNVAGATDIETAAQAASALRLLAGDFAFVLFAWHTRRRSDRHSGTRRFRGGSE